MRFTSLIAASLPTMAIAQSVNFWTDDICISNGITDFVSCGVCYNGPTPGARSFSVVNFEGSGSFSTYSDSTCNFQGGGYTYFGNGNQCEDYSGIVGGDTIGSFRFNC